jgi:hypothetical protein
MVQARAEIALISGISCSGCGGFRAFKSADLEAAEMFKDKGLWLPEGSSLSKRAARLDCRYTPDLTVFLELYLQRELRSTRNVVIGETCYGAKRTGP